MSVFIATHKKADMPELEGYIPVQVGAALNGELGYLSDAQGDNISEKNPNYCELTALYYIWKNIHNENAIGLVHYRRFFYKNSFSLKESKIVSYRESCKILEKYDVILPSKAYLRGTVKEHYAKYHIIDDWNKCRQIIKEQYPDYLKAFECVEQRKYLYPYNMFIMKEENFNDYMDWLFTILFELEKTVNLADYNSYNKRIYGFLSERLFNVWIEKNNLKIRSFPVLNTERSIIQNNIDIIKNFIKKIIG